MKTPSNTICHFSLRGGQQGLVRFVKKEDAQKVLMIKKEILEKEVCDSLLLEEYALDVAQEEQWIAQGLQGEKSFLAVCEVENSVVGVLYFQSSPEARCSHWGEFGMGVTEKWCGHGLGTKLIDALLEWAKTCPGLEKVCLKVFDANPMAHKFYQKLGFAEEGRLKKCLKLKQGIYSDAILMAKFVK